MFLKESPHLLFSGGASLNQSFLHWSQHRLPAQARQLCSSPKAHLISSSRNSPYITSFEASEPRLCSPAVMVSYMKDVAKP
ncbi:hypothetical protein F2Q70_00000511 [Brassica cretica]|uniref:Uncharacterized protein n=1 Tax=Brassica cretica TaxID=69181 RepID=A0A8S9J247_BRACR|nr:hypothetical protein F2Q70_00000511 [Brassica cretica]